MKFNIKSGALINLNLISVLLLFISILMMPMSVSATPAPVDSGGSFELAMPTIEASGTEGEQLLALAMGFLYLVALVAGIVFLFQGILKLIKGAKNPNDPQGSLKSVFLSFVAAALLTNVYGSASLFINTVTGNQAFCFLNAKNMTGELKIPTVTDGCFDAESSEISKNLKERLSASTTENWDQFKRRIEIFFSIVQIIGMYYFVKSLFLLKSSADGRQDSAGFGKILIMMIFSAIAMDLSGAIEIIIRTITSITGNDLL